MPLNQKLIVDIIFDQVQEIDDRYSDYREIIKDIVVDILLLERQDLISHSNIQQKINEKCNSAGRLLADHMQ
jgi:hypothetical protein